jgi:hypothetical protein
MLLLKLFHLGYDILSPATAPKMLGDIADDID